MLLARLRNFAQPSELGEPIELLRAGDPRYFKLMLAVARLASPTGQWPEAIHPRTGGSCMGDGQHAWAAAEWLMMIRNCFVREEGETLTIGSRIDRSWLHHNGRISFGPAPTNIGTLTLRITADAKLRELALDWTASWHSIGPTLQIRFTGYTPIEVAAEHGSVRLLECR